MKKYILIILLVIAVVFGLTKVYYAKLHECEEIVSEFNSRLDLGKYDFIFENFYMENGVYPSSFEQFIDTMKFYNPSSDVDSYFRYVYEDYFTIDSLGVFYYPVFDRQTKEAVSYLLFSVGPDRKRNNYISDSLYTDDWQYKVAAYNSYEAMAEMQKVTAIFVEDEEMYNKGIRNGLKTTLDSEDVFNELTKLKGDELKKEIYLLKFSPHIQINTECIVWNAFFGRKDYIIGVGKKIVVMRNTEVTSFARSLGDI